MKTHVLVVLGFAALTAAAASGCAAPTDAVDEEASSEDALSNRQLPGVVAVEVAEVRGVTEVLSSKTVGAPKKVKTLAKAVKKLGAHEPQPRCMERDTTRLTFLDASAKKIATVQTHCAGFGSISFEGGKPGYAVKFDSDLVASVKDAPFAVGDALWGVSAIELSKPGNSQQSVTLTGADVEPVLDGFDLDQVPDANASFPRCLPSHVLKFKRGDASVAHTSFLCGSTSASDAPSSVKAQFRGIDPAAPPNAEPIARGGIDIDPRPVLRALEPRN